MNKLNRDVVGNMLFGAKNMINFIKSNHQFSKRSDLMEEANLIIDAIKRLICSINSRPND